MLFLNKKHTKFWLLPTLIICSLAHNNDADLIRHNDKSEFRADSFWSTAQLVAKKENIGNFFYGIENHFKEKRSAHIRDVGLTN